MAKDTGVLHPKPLTPLRISWETGLFLNANSYFDCPIGCRYCYSRLNREHHNVKGKTKTNAALGTLTSLLNKCDDPNRYNPERMLDFLIHEKFPIMFSNNSDALSNLEIEYGYSKQYLDVFADYQIPVNLCSKWQGWKHLDQDAYIETFKRFDKFFASITITSDDDETLKKWEPGAPTFKERLAIIRQLTDAGIYVDVRVIPFMICESFQNGQWDDPETYRPFLQQIKDAGAQGVAIATLDFSIYDASVCDHVCKKYVADNEWCRSQEDKPWKYFTPDVEIMTMVSQMWYDEAKKIGLRCSVHPAFSSLVMDYEDIRGVAVGPEWLDMSLSWIRMAHGLRQAQEAYDRPILTTSREVAELVTEGHPYADHQFLRKSCRDLMPYVSAKPSGDDMVAEFASSEYITFADLMKEQMDSITTWSDSIFADIAISPVTDGGDTQLFDDNDGVFMIYDADNPRDSLAASRDSKRCTKWLGRDIVNEYDDCVLLDGEPANVQILDAEEA